MFNTLDVCYRNGKHETTRSLREGDHKEVAHDACRLTQLMKLFIKLLISEHKYDIDIHIKPTAGNVKEGMQLLDREIKPVEYHPAIRGLNNDQRNLLFFLVNALAYKEAKSRLELYEGTFKDLRAALYNILKASKVAYLTKIAAEHRWFMCQRM